MTRENDHNKNINRVWRTTTLLHSHNATFCHISVRYSLPSPSRLGWKDFVLFSLSEAGAVCNSTPLGSIVTTPLFSLCFLWKTKNWFQIPCLGCVVSVGGGEVWAVLRVRGHTAAAINNKYKELRPTTASCAKYKIQIPSYIIQWGIITQIQQSYTRHPPLENKIK